MGPALIDVGHSFEDLLQHKNDDTLTNVSLAACRVPTNFGDLEGYKKNLAAFLLNLSRHKDDPIISVTKNSRIDRIRPLLAKTRLRRY